MGIEFKDSCFSYTLSGETPHIENPKVKFTYAEIDPQNYKNMWDIRSEGENWLGRWLYAIPGMGVATVKAVYHIAKLIFFDIPRALCTQQKPLKTHVFVIVRDLQEFAGRFISFFNVYHGQYYVECSDYHKTCYAMYLAHKPT